MAKWERLLEWAGQFKGFECRLELRSVEGEPNLVTATGLETLIAHLGFRSWVWPLYSKASKGP